MPKDRTDGGIGRNARVNEQIAPSITNENNPLTRPSIHIVNGLYKADLSFAVGP